MPPANDVDAGKLLTALREELTATRQRLQTLTDFTDSQQQDTKGSSPQRRTSLNNQALLFHDVGRVTTTYPYTRTTRRKEILVRVEFPQGFAYDSAVLNRPLQLVPDDVRATTGSYGFNALTMDVSTMMVHWFLMFQELDLMAKFKIAPETLREFFRCVHNGYRANTYHNFQHAMDVAQFTFALWSNSPELQKHFTDLDMLSCVLLGLAHDMDHPGVNNAFLIQTRDPIAILYNDRSVLENAHAAGLFYMLMTRPDANILANLEPAQYEKVRKFVLSGILATDMSRHFDLVKNIKDMPPAVDVAELDDKQRGALVDLIAKSSDICHLVRPWAVAKAWEDLVQEEFFEQGDQEKALGMEPMGMLDREKCKVPNSQCWFYENMGKPLYETLACHFPSTQCLVHTLMEQNLPEWKALIEE
jgi:hypothetical protein